MATAEPIDVSAQSTTEPNAAKFFAVTVQVGVVEICVAVIVGFMLLGRFPGAMNGIATDVLLGVLGAAPLFLVIYGSGTFNEFIFRRVAPHLAALSTAQLVAIAVVLSVGEELLFRGLLPQLMAALDPIWAIVVANALFAACYAVSKGSWLTMFLFGCYLSALYTAGDEDGILRPILAHGLFMAILLPMIASAYRRHASPRTTDEKSESVSPA